jgi:protein-disulfide isomerase
MSLRPALLSLFALPLALAACSEGGGGTGNGATAATPVAAASAPAGQSWIDTVVKTPEGYRMGNPDAPIKLVEYGARSCPACGAFSRASAQPLAETYVASGKVSFEFRDFLVHGISDMPGALLAACAGPGPFFALTDAMYANQNDYLDRLQKISPADQQRMQNASPTQAVTFLAEQGGLIEFVKQRGIPEAKARQCLNDQAALEAVAKITENASKEGKVTGTPTFYLNDERVQAGDWPSIEEALKKAGA